MGKYQAYSEYRDSGVEWLDKVPSHWNSVPIKYMALESGSLFLDGNWIESKDISGDEIRYITTGNVGEGCYKEQGTGYITEEKFQQLNCTEVFEGDILISRLNEPIGRSCIVPDLRSRIVTSVDNVIFRPDKKYNKKYIVYLFSSKDYFKHTSNLARGATMQRISRGLLGNIRVVAPPIDEQEKIANFLDHETTKIDTLIDKQQQLIQLLKEKRQAVISHAVTKGLNPNAPMRDSGVEWLGEVPEHWELWKLAHAYNDIGSGTTPPSGEEKWYEGDIPWITTGELRENVILKTRKNVSNETIAAFPALRKYPPGSIAIAMYGATIGRLGVFGVEATTNQACCVFTTSKVINNLYLFYWLQAYKDEIINLSSGGGQPNINQEKVSSLKLSAPDLDEQLEITNYLDKIIDEFERLELLAHKQINLLQERRTALISAAVTGKIDVRHHACHPTGDLQSSKSTVHGDL